MAQGFQKGVVTNPKGRGSGTLNKTTKDIKEAYRLLIEKNLDNLTEWLKKVAEKDPEKAIRIVSDLSEYIIPKLARTDLTSGDQPIQSVVNINVTSKESADKLKDFISGESK
jgi:uncharacterized protein YutE (UPF0331/DUF86 family)